MLPAMRFAGSAFATAEEVPVADFVAVANALPANRIAGSMSDLSED